MHHLTCKNLQLGLIILLMLPLPALAMPAISCHCFTERSYDAAHPATANHYFLASAQNSFFAIVFKTDKKSVVFKKQQWASSDDLWIAYWIASASGGSSECLLEARQKSGSWKETIAPLRLSTKALGARFSNAQNCTASNANLAEAVVDELFLRYRLLDEWELKGMRQVGVSNQELILATLVGARTGKPARPVYQEVKNGSKTWGSLLHSAGIDTKNRLQEITGLLPRQ